MDEPKREGTRLARKKLAKAAVMERNTAQA
jgi:hypothetical protein